VPADDQARDVRDIGHHVRADFIGDGAELREVDRAGIGAIAAENDLWFQLQRFGGTELKSMVSVFGSSS